jgi:hypothetical protein
MFGYELSLNNEADLGGIFIALVVDNKDPKALERIKVRVLGVHDIENTNKDNSIWANHVAPSKSNSGEIPDINDFVYVMFLQKDPSACCWLGWLRTIEG